MLITQFASISIDKKKSGTKLRNVMHSKHFTIRDMSLFLGVSEKSVKNWISGISLPSVANFVRIRQILGVTTKDILVKVEK